MELICGTGVARQITPRGPERARRRRIEMEERVQRVRAGVKIRAIRPRAAQIPLNAAAAQLIEG
jgi:hypothetical protein